MLRIAAFWNGLVVVCLLVGFPVAAQQVPATAPPKDDFEGLRAVFELPGLPSVQGKTFAVVETGAANWSHRLEGWVIEDTHGVLLLRQWHGELTKLRKPRPGENRPRLPEEPGGGVRGDVLAAMDTSVVWRVTPEDYTARLTKFLAQGLPKDRDKDEFFGLINQIHELGGHIVDAARHAHFAQELGLRDQARSLLAQAHAAKDKYSSRHPSNYAELKLYEVVAERVVTGLRCGAIHKANDGLPRRELKKLWEHIAAMSYHSHREEARELVKQYELMLAEDARWTEPTAGDRAKMTTDQQVAYWLYKLRDLRVSQWSFPGMCSVLDSGLGRKSNDEPNPAQELEKLGLAAVPQLIAHLDDSRPTGCYGCWRHYSPEGYHLLRYGDCCQQIFEAITGQDIYRRATSSSYPHNDGKAKECKAKAQEWWQKEQSKRAK